MRNGLLVCFVALAICPSIRADDPTFETTRDTEESLKALVERLEVRVTELESEVSRLKYAQKRAVIGGSILDRVDLPTDEAPPPQRRHVLSASKRFNRHWDNAC